ncbi:chemotaxis response regulator protein-glutamate methylesterase [Clostridiaceae bacterium 35-E11]
MNKVRVLVVDDSAFMRKIISDMIALDKEFIVVGTARNGKEAIQKIKELSPHVVTMDVEMPEMDGLAALDVIMKQFARPVVMLSSLTNEGADATLKALELGAVDFITKPVNVFKVNTEEIQAQLIEKIKVASRVKVSQNKLFRPSTKKMEIKSREKTSVLLDENKSIKKIVAIGTSTGGPKALQEIIPYLPKNIPASILIVQHMPPGFTKSLAERLNNISAINVKEAENNETLLAGWAYIAPGDHHLELKNEGNLLKIKLTKTKPVSGHRPSVDVMMNSLAQLNLGDKVISVIMTGMGSDGAEGMKNIKLNKGYTVAQDEATCVVYGMPKSAINLGCIDKIVPLHDIAGTITQTVGV